MKTRRINRLWRAKSIWLMVLFIISLFCLSSVMAYTNNILYQNIGYREFNGLDSYIADTSTQAINNSFIITVWVYPRSLTNAHRILEKGVNTDWALTLTPTTVYFRDDSGHNVEGSLTLNSWNFLTVIFDGYTTSLYKDGALLNYGLNAKYSDVSNIITIGNYGGADKSYAFDGYIDEVRIFNGTNSSQDLAIASEMFNRGRNESSNVEIMNDIANKGLIYYNKLNSPVKDEVANVLSTTIKTTLKNDFELYSNNRTIENISLGYSSLKEDVISYYKLDGNSNDVLNSNNGNFNASIVTGKINTALSFNGSTDYILIAKPSFANFSVSDSFTLGYWLNKTDDTSDITFAKMGTGFSSGYYFTTRNNYFSLTLFNGTDSFGTNSLTYPSTINKWSHFVITYNDRNITFYKDGMFIGSFLSSIPTNAIITNSQNVGIGKRASFAGLELNGTIDEIGIWNRSLSPTEVQELYNNGTGQTYPFGNFRYINIPTTANYITNAKLNISLIANFTNSSGITSYSLPYSAVNTGGQFTMNLTANFSVYRYVNNSLSFSVYSSITGIPSRTYFIDTFTTPDICLNFTTNVIKLNITKTNTADLISAYCLNRTNGYTLLGTTTDKNARIDGLWISYIDTRLSSITMVDNLIFNQTSSINNKTNNFASYLNQYRSSCVIIGGYCQIPILFSSDSDGILQYSNLQIDNFGFTENSQNFTNSVLELTTNQFSINVTYDTNYYTTANVYLNYNGTNYIASTNNTGNTKTYTRSLLAPSILVNSNISFYWIFALFNGTTTEFYNSTFNNQTVLNQNIGICNGSNTIKIMNFTNADEETRGNLTGNTYKIDLKIGDPTLTNFIQFSSNLTGNSLPICLNITPTQNYRMDYILQYGSPSKYTEFYSVQNYTLNSSTLNQNITVYPLSNVTTNNYQFLIKVTDSNFLALQGAVIEIYRKYNELGSFLLVEAPTTDSLGQTIGHFVTQDVIYSIYIKKNGNILATYDNIQLYCNPLITDCILNLNIAGSSAIPSDYISERGISYIPYYNLASKTYSISFQSTDGTDKNISIYGFKLDNTQNEMVCSNSISGSGGSLPCAIPTLNGNNTILINAYLNGELLFTDYVNADYSKRNTIGNVRYILLAFLLPFFALFSLSSGALAVVFYILGLIFGIGIYALDTQSYLGAGSFLIWFVVAGIILIIKIMKGGIKNG